MRIEPSIAQVKTFTGTGENTDHKRWAGYRFQPRIIHAVLSGASFRLPIIVMYCGQKQEKTEPFTSATHILRNCCNELAWKELYDSGQEDEEDNASCAIL